MHTILLCTEFLGEAEISFWRGVSASLKARGSELIIAMPGTSGMHDGLIVLPEASRFASLSTQPYPLQHLDLKLFQEGLDWNRRWETSFHESNMRSILRGLEAQLVLTKPHLVLLWSGLRPVNFVLRHLARSLGIPTRVAERTPWPMMLSLDEEGSLLATDAYRLSLAESKAIARDSSASKTGNDYYRDLQRGGTTWWEQPESQDLAALRQRLGIKPGQEVLLFAGQIDTDVQQFLFSPHFESNLEAFEAFCASVPNDGRNFIFGKHHPKSKTSKEHYTRAVGDKGCWVDDVSLNDAFALADRVVAVNSAVIFESMALRKPTMALGDSMMKGHDLVVEWANNSDHKATRRWLEMEPQEADERRERFVRLTGHFVEHDFYSMLAGGVRGFERFADDCLNIAANAKPNWCQSGITVSDLAGAIDDGLAIRRSRVASGVLAAGRQFGRLRSKLKRRSGGSLRQ